MSAERYVVERHGLASGEIRLLSGRQISVWGRADGKFVTDAEINELERDEIQHVLSVMHMDFTGYVH